jgi:2-amino-4-hydroxy-6-hydroxymethyldihydropteridine diphosphokinase
VNQATHQACLLLGSNIRAEENLLQAVRGLQGRVDVLRASSVWETAAVGSDGPNFLNLALLVSTFLDAAGLKQDVLRPLEAALGRVRSVDKNAARPIDLDIIVFDGKPVDDLLWKHAYRAVPVSELLPELSSDGGETLVQAAARLAAGERVNRRADLSYAFR